jgi:ABC-type branched-subunit amino acid transport system ATPase component
VEDAGAGSPSLPALLVAEGVVKSFGGIAAVDGVDLSLAPGSLGCIIGPNGCGKTTLFNLMTGYLKPDAGAIRFLGRSIPGQPLHAIARQGLVRKFQVPSVFPALSVAQNLTAATWRTTGQTQALTELFAGIDLDLDDRRPAGILSHGQKQWLELAMVLSAAPRLVLLDEPAAGMTAAEKAATLRLIERLRRETQIAVLVIEHDMAFVEALDCPIRVMVLGRVVAQGRFEDVRRDPLVRKAYLGAGHG